MRRRQILGAALAAAAGPLARPALAQADGSRVIRFIPQSDLTILDPLWTTAYVTRNHAFCVFDTLYGSDHLHRPHPQMVDGHVVEDDGKRWTLTLRDGLMFHDGTPVLARDCVASITRWAKRDAYGQALMAATDTLMAGDDKTIVFRLNRPFPRLPEALGKIPSLAPVMMPERLAKTDAFTQVTEMVGSGPFRFVADERVPGVRVVYQRFDGYKPRPDGVADTTSGPKIVNVDRVEWQVIPDFSTAAAALQSGEVDWWEVPAADLLPLLRRTAKVTVDVIDPLGNMHLMRMNQLHPPFDNPAVRRAVLAGIDQAEFVQAYAGSDAALWRTNVGFYPPGTELACDAGLSTLAAPSVDRARAALRAAGYQGERIVYLSAGDLSNSRAMAQVGADLMHRMGMNVDYQELDWGTVNQRRAKKEPVDQGGWSVFSTLFYSLDMIDPAGNLPLRGTGQNAWVGWPTDARIEALRGQWLQADNASVAKSLAADIQQEAFSSLPYIPLGQTILPTAYRTSLSFVPRGLPAFWGVRKAA